MRRLLVIAFVLAATSTLPYAAGAPEDWENLPLLASAFGYGWHAFKITTDGGVVYVSALADSGSWVSEVSLVVFDGDDEVRGWGHAWAGNGESDAEVRGHLAPLGDFLVGHGTPPPSGNSSAAVSFVVNDPEFGTPRPQTLKFLAWGEGQWRIDIRGAPGVAVVGRTSGPGDFHYDQSDFAAPASVEARAFGGLAAARAYGSGTLTIPVHERLYAIYEDFGFVPQGELLRVETPSGDVLCPCLGGDDFAGLGVGDYTFRLDGVGTTAGFGDVDLRGADAKLPE